MDLGLAGAAVCIQGGSKGMGRTYVSDQMVRHIETLPADAGVSADDPTSVMRYISEFFGGRADLGRAGNPSDIGPVICFPASERKPYLTGANVNVDGASNVFASPRAPAGG
jgi:3-oxoacyl-[acyl-carrier protein] reductase